MGLSMTPAPSPPVPATTLPPTQLLGSGPITDVNALPTVGANVGKKIKKAAGLTTALAGPQPVLNEATPPALMLATPGSERWPVKTGQDPDRAKVGKNLINGHDLGAGIVPATLEEMIRLPRPPGLEVLTQDPPQFKSVRDGVAEITIWEIEATIIALKHEKDGDYHLVLQGVSGAEMVGEIPTPTSVFVGDSPWIANIGQARKAIDDKFVKHLSPSAFALLGNQFVPSDAAAFQPQMIMADSVSSFETPAEGSGIIQPLFQTQLTPTKARLTGVGFFDRSHGATGAAPNVIELHPVLKIEWL